MFKHPKRSTKLNLRSQPHQKLFHRTSVKPTLTADRDRSTIFKEILLDAALKNEFGFKEQDILPLFIKYQSKRQILIDLISFLTYVVQLPTRFYLRRAHKSKFALERSNSHFDWFTTSSSKLSANKR